MEQVSIQGMTRDEPSVQQVRHTRKFDKAELAKALRFYLEANGHTVPSGDEYFYGLERVRGCEPEKEGLTFVVRENDISAT